MDRREAVRGLAMTALAPLLPTSVPMQGEIPNNERTRMMLREFCHKYEINEYPIVEQVYFESSLLDLLDIAFGRIWGLQQKVDPPTVQHEIERR